MFAHTSQSHSSSGRSFRPIGEPTRAELPSKLQSTLLPRLCASRDRQRHASARIPGPLPHVPARVRQHSVGRCDGACGCTSMRTSSPSFCPPTARLHHGSATLANSSQLFLGGSGNCSRRNPLVRRDLLAASHRREPPDDPFLMTILGLECCSAQRRPGTCGSGPGIRTRGMRPTDALHRQLGPMQKVGSKRVYYILGLKPTFCSRVHLQPIHFTVN